MCLCYCIMCYCKELLIAAICRLIRAVGHKLKRIGALAHPLRAEKDEDVVMGAHTLTGVEELLENCFQALENYTGQSAVLGSVVWLPATLAEGSAHPFHRSCAFSFLGFEIIWETVSEILHHMISLWFVQLSDLKFQKYIGDIFRT